jgi:RNA polymerase sigma-70 factor (family 1)
MAAPGVLSDQELLGLLRSGDRAAYTEIYTRYKFILHHHAWNKVRNREEAQDILQEVFTNLWLKRETLRIDSNLSGYLYNAVRNRILDYFAHHEVKVKYVNAVEPNLTLDVATDYRVRENQLRRLIELEIAELPPRTREVFKMSRNQHLTHREIAEQLGTSEETVKKQMAHALRVLRVKLGIFVYLFILFRFWL